VTWPAANGQGHEISSYRVTSITGGVTAPVGAVTDLTMTLAKGALKYGTQYAFTVVAINDINAASDPSKPSNTIVPFTVPGAPVNLGAATVPTARGSIQVNWQAAPANGRPVTKYVIESPRGTSEVPGSATSTVLANFPDDTAVQVKVHAVNVAGPGPDGTASARTIGVPTITVTAETPGWSAVSVTFTPNNKGGNATCTLALNGAAVSSAACGTQPVTLSGGNVWPNNTYAYTVSITNPAGQGAASGNVSTNQLHGTVICPNNTNGYCNSGIYVYSVASNNNPGQALGTYSTGTTYTPQCWTSNDNVDARPWGGKNSPVWLRVDYNGRTGYFPWAWSSLDGGDNYGMIPQC
jgi:Fibronectin type III domain